MKRQSPSSWEQFHHKMCWIKITLERMDIMSQIGFPTMPMYTDDQESYIRQMYEWHSQMIQHHDQQREYHLERAQQLQQFMAGSVQSSPRKMAKKKVNKSPKTFRGPIKRKAI